MPKCAECGYLAARDQQTRDLKEAEVGMRERWEIPADPHGMRPYYDLVPVCFARATDFAKQVGPEQSRARVVELIQLARDCSSFTEWQHGRSPREHEEMKLAEEQRKRDLAWQEERRQADSKAQEARLTADRVWQEGRRQDDNARNESRDKTNRRWQGQLAMIAAAVTILNGLAGVVIGRWLQPPPPQPPPVIVNLPPAEKADPKAGPVPALKQPSQ